MCVTVSIPFLFVQIMNPSFCFPGLIEVWIILLEQLTAAVSNCPRQHQPPTLDLLFELLRDVTKTPGNYFYGYLLGELLHITFFQEGISVSTYLFHCCDPRQYNRCSISICWVPMMEWCLTYVLLLFLGLPTSPFTNSVWWPVSWMCGAPQ